MKKVLYIVMAFALLLGVSSCSEWLNVNTDPDSPSNQSATEEVRLPWIQYYYSYAWGTANTRASAIAQVVMGTSRTATVGEQALWNPDTGVSTTVYQNWFLGAACNIPDLMAKAEEHGAYHYMGAALVVKAMGSIMMADLYGEMPYTYAVGEDFTPSFDNGEVMYAGSLADLDKAIEYFSKPQENGAPALSAGDIWNGGDVQKWIKLAYGLKARWLNNLSKVTVEKNGLKYDPTAILAALENAPKTASENITMKHYNVETASTNFTVGDAYGPNVTYDSAAWGTGQRLNRWFVQLLTNFRGSGVEDPRADKILPSAMYKAVLNAEGDRITTYDWLRDEGVDVTGVEAGWKDNRMVSGNLNGYLTLAVKDVAKKYDKATIEKYYVSVDAFKAAIAKYYSAENVTVSDDTLQVKEEGVIKEVKDVVKVVYHPGAMYVNDSNPLYVEDIKFVQLRSDGVFETEGLASNDMNCYYSGVSADTRRLGFVQGTGSFYTRIDSDSYICTAAEMNFIKAEVLFRQGNAAGAYEAYKTAIKEHFAQMNTKLATWTGIGCGKTARGFDVEFAYSPIPQADIDAYMASAAVAQSAAALTMADIMMQKVIAMGVDYQNWNDVRRYNYSAGTVGNYGVVYEGMTTPKYRPMGSSSFNPDPKNSHHYPRRWMHCSHETGYNATECNKSVEQYRQYGVDNASDFDVWNIPVWWDWD